MRCFAIPFFNSWHVSFAKRGENVTSRETLNKLQDLFNKKLKHLTRNVIETNISERVGGKHGVIVNNTKLMLFPLINCKINR